MSPAEWGGDGPVNRLDTSTPGEPVAIAEAVRLALVAIVGAGWVAIPDTTINIIVSAVGVVGSIVATVLARRRVTPIAKGQ